MSVEKVELITMAELKNNLTRSRYMNKSPPIKVNLVTRVGVLEELIAVVEFRGVRVYRPKAQFTINHSIFDVDELSVDVNINGT